MVSADVIRIVLADDHAPMRARLREVLERGGCEVCGEAATAEDAIQLSRRHRPQVALLDIDMPGSGIHAAREISRELPDTAVVMLTLSRDDNDLFDSLRAGAMGYLTKDGDPEELVPALRVVLSGDAAMAPGLVARLLDEFRPTVRRRFGRSSPAAAKLSAREWEIMSMLAEGESTAEVACRLFISPTTVRVHVSAVLRKLHARDRESAFDLLRGD